MKIVGAKSVVRKRKANPAAKKATARKVARKSNPSESERVTSWVGSRMPEYHVKENDTLTTVAKFQSLSGAKVFAQVWADRSGKQMVILKTMGPAGQWFSKDKTGKWR